MPTVSLTRVSRSAGCIPSPTSKVSPTHQSAGSSDHCYWVVAFEVPVGVSFDNQIYNL